MQSNISKASSFGVVLFHIQEAASYLFGIWGNSSNTLSPGAVQLASPKPYNKLITGDTFLIKGMETYYMKWRDDVAKLKGLSLDAEERENVINQYKNAKVLYIDDLFKTGRNPDGTEPKPTAADINIAFEIINHRYCNPSLLTIISSELSINELIDIDEATGGRICERAKVTNIAKDRTRNYRTKNAVTI